MARLAVRADGRVLLRRHRGPTDVTRRLRVLLIRIEAIRSLLWFCLSARAVSNFSAGKLREAAVLDSEFRAESESGLRSAQSPAGKDEKFSQSPAAEMRCVLAGWLLAGRRLAAACC